MGGFHGFCFLFFFQFANKGRLFEGYIEVEFQVEEFVPASLYASLLSALASHSDEAWHAGTAHFLALNCSEKEKGTHGGGELFH